MKDLLTKDQVRILRNKMYNLAIHVNNGDITKQCALKLMNRFITAEIRKQNICHFSLVELK